MSLIHPMYVSREPRVSQTRFPVLSRAHKVPSLIEEGEGQETQAATNKPGNSPKARWRVWLSVIESDGFNKRQSKDVLGKISRSSENRRKG